MATSEHEQQDSSTVRIILISIGFSLMLAWHYLILFSPVFGDIGALGEVDGDYLFARQLTLYIMIALAFGTLLLHGRWRMAHPKPDSRRTAYIYIIGMFSLAVGTLYVLGPHLELPFPVRLTLIGILGVLQAIMMVLWMRCLIKQHDGHVLSSFGIYMISGGTIAVIVCYFQWPISLIAAVILPFASSLILAYIKTMNVRSEEGSEYEKDGNEEDSLGDAAHEENGKSSIQEDKITRARNVRLILFSGVFAFSFGLLQGSFIIVNIPILIVTNAAMLLGLVCAGLIIHLLPKSTSAILAVDLMHRYSVILFITGTAVIMWYNMGRFPMVVSQIALLAGFNLFDFGLFVFGVEGNWNMKNQAPGCDLARPVVYLSMSLGLLIGYLILRLTPGSSMFQSLLVICGVCIIMIVATALFPLLRHSDNKTSNTEEDGEGTRLEGSATSPAVMSLSAFPTSTSTPEELESRPVSPWKNACREISEQYRLSPRETEIFFLIARGRNADYIQKELIISPHTAKTHIANIYHKLDVHSAQELLDLVEECKHARRA